jgi:hypothetical protein
VPVTRAWVKSTGLMTVLYQYFLNGIHFRAGKSLCMPIGMFMYPFAQLYSMSTFRASWSIGRRSTSTSYT